MSWQKAKQNEHHRKFNRNSQPVRWRRREGHGQKRRDAHSQYMYMHFMNDGQGLLNINLCKNFWLPNL